MADTLGVAPARRSTIINLVGILNETAAPVRSGPRRVRTQGSRGLQRPAGVPRLVQMSALNADVRGPSRYLGSKGEAEAIVAASGLV